MQELDDELRVRLQERLDLAKALHNGKTGNRTGEVLIIPGTKAKACPLDYFGSDIGIGHWIVGHHKDLRFVAGVIEHERVHIEEGHEKGVWWSEKVANKAMEEVCGELGRIIPGEDMRLIKRPVLNRRHERVPVDVLVGGYKQGLIEACEGRLGKEDAQKIAEDLSDFDWRSGRCWVYGGG